MDKVCLLVGWSVFFFFSVVNRALTSMPMMGIKKVISTSRQNMNKRLPIILTVYP